MRTIVIGAVACALGACASGNKAGDWTIEQRADRMSDKPQYTSYLIARSRNAYAESQDPVQVPQASLQLMCFDHGPIVRMRFTHRVGSTTNARAAYRFDENPARDIDIRILQDFRTVVVEDRNDVARFVDELRTASKLAIQITSLNMGTSLVDFRVQDAPKAIEAAYANCPLPTTKPRVTGVSARVI